MSTEPMFTVTLYGSAEAAREAEVKWLRGRVAVLEAALGQGLEIVRAENDALRADAERYRWLRDNCVRRWRSDMPHNKGAQTLDFEFDGKGHDPDAAIDAARAAREG